MPDKTLFAEDDLPDAEKLKGEEETTLSPDEKALLAKVLDSEQQIYKRLSQRYANEEEERARAEAIQMAVAILRDSGLEYLTDQYKKRSTLVPVPGEPLPPQVVDKPLPPRVVEQNDAVETPAAKPFNTDTSGLSDEMKNQLWWEIERTNEFVDSLLTERASKLSKEEVFRLAGVLKDQCQQELREAIAVKFGLPLNEAVRVYEGGKNAEWKTKSRPLALVNHRPPGLLINYEIVDYLSIPTKDSYHVRIALDRLPTDVEMISVAADLRNRAFSSTVVGVHYHELPAYATISVDPLYAYAVVTADSTNATVTFYPDRVPEQFRSQLPKIDIRSVGETASTPSTSDDLIDYEVVEYRVFVLSERYSLLLHPVGDLPTVDQMMTVATQLWNKRGTTTPAGSSRLNKTEIEFKMPSVGSGKTFVAYAEIVVDSFTKPAIKMFVDNESSGESKE